MNTPSRVGPYTIEREVGRGGMGIVHLGRDTRLGREVAIKMLPEAFSHDPERVQRFEREARLLASLSHPNIAGIHGLEEQDGQRYLVLEYVPGETLAERIARGALTADDAADIGRQIAAALEAAHESGVIHRDLKPGNVKITPTGEVKVLDFGLAKGVAAASGVSATDISQSPTIAVTATGAGVILGTAAYMSPEQARAKPVDRRTDIWSFGCVLYECLTARRAFAGETVSDMIAQILQGQPDWSVLPADTPPRMRALLERCLEKDARKRLRDIGEAKLVLESPHEPISGVAQVSTPAPAHSRLLSRAGWIFAAAFALTSAGLLWRVASRPDTPTVVTRLTALPPPGVLQVREPVFASLSPDGRMLAFSCGDSGGTASLWLRSLDEPVPRRLQGSEGALIPAWSPDSRSIAFATQEKLRRVDVRGGAPQTLADARSGGRGTAWGSRGDIVFAPGGNGPLYAVPANGGPTRQVTTLDSAETAHRFPEFLPDGVHFLYSAIPARGQGFDIYVGSTDGKTREHLMNCDGVPRYAEPGWLVFTRNGRLLAQSFDPEKRRLGDRIMALADAPTSTDYLGGSRVIVSANGPLAYQTGGLQPTELVEVIEGGREIRRIPAPEGRYVAMAISPDLSQLAVVKEVSTTEADLWILDLDRGGARRVTHGGSKVDGPAWSPDGGSLSYAAMLDGRTEVFAGPIAGGEPRVLKTPPGTLKYGASWSPDGRQMIAHILSEKSGWDLWILSTDGIGEPVLYAGGPYDESFANISPDGRWVSYVSFETGSPEVYVQSFPTPGRRYQVSVGGGTVNQWGRDGRRLMYRSLEGAPLLVNLTFDDGVRASKPYPLMAGPPPPILARVLVGSIPRDLDRVFVSVETADVGAQSPFTIVQNWRAALEPQ
jgi:Tol biopolymer transport system component